MKPAAGLIVLVELVGEEVPSNLFVPKLFFLKPRIRRRRSLVSTQSASSECPSCKFLSTRASRNSLRATFHRASFAPLRIEMMNYSLRPPRTDRFGSRRQFRCTRRRYIVSCVTVPADVDTDRQRCDDADLRPTSAAEAICRSVECRFSRAGIPLRLHVLTVTWDWTLL